jgi:hypothetical protein
MASPPFTFSIVWTLAFPKAVPMETFEQRLKRYTSKDDLEIFGYMTVYRIRPVNPSSAVEVLA